MPFPPLKALPVLALLGAASSAALATELVVTTHADEFDGICDAHCSLRDAVQTANMLPGADRILLDGTYQLTLATTGETDEDDNQSGDLDIRDVLAITGRETDGTVIRGEGLNDRIFEVLPGARLILDRLTLSGGVAPDYGGALENHGDAVLSRVTLSDNRAAARNDDDPSGGGAIANFGVLVLHYSTLAGNEAMGRNQSAYGGALYNQGRLLLRDTWLKDNLAYSWGDSGLGGALYNIGQADIARSAFLGHWVPEAGRASGILNDGAGVLKVSNSTFSDNVSLSPVLLNQVPNQAGTPRMELSQVTLVDNLGPAVENGGWLRVRNSIMAGNWDEDGEYAGACWNFGDGYRFEAAGLLLGTDSGTCPADLYIEDSQTLTHLVRSLDERTLTHPLRPGSPALDAGIGSCPDQDQRRQPRPQDGDGDGVALCDLGAYELQP